MTQVANNRRNLHDLPVARIALLMQGKSGGCDKIRLSDGETLASGSGGAVTRSWEQRDEVASGAPLSRWRETKAATCTVAVYFGNQLMRSVWPGYGRPSNRRTDGARRLVAHPLRRP